MTAPRSRLARLAATGALAAAATLTLGACGASPGPGVAAVSDGQVVHESDLDSIAQDFGKVPGAQAPSRTEMVSLLVARPYVMQVLGANAITEEGVRQLLSKELPDVSPATVRYIQAASSQQRLDQATAAKVQKAMAAGDIKVDPRYGQFDPGKGLVPATENWLVPSGASAATP